MKKTKQITPTNITQQQFKSNLEHMPHSNQNCKRLCSLTALFIYVVHSLFFSAPALAQEVSCDLSVAPSIFLKSIKTNIKKQKKLSAQNRTKSKLSTRTIVAKPTLYPATILKLQGKVLLISRSNVIRAEPTVLTVGSTLQLNDVIQTFEQSFISLELGDGVISVMPSNSKITLSQSSEHVARFILINGRVETYAPKHIKALKNTFEIQVPNAIIGVRGTHFLISHSIETHQTKAKVEEGTLWVRSRQVCRPPLVIEAGQGADIGRVDYGTSAIALLPTPDFLDLDKAQGKKDATFNLTPVQDAKAYHIQIANDPYFMDIQNEASNSKPQVKFKNINLSNGFYYVRSSAIDTNGIEGLSDVRFFLTSKEKPEFKSTSTAITRGLVDDF